MGLHRAVGLSVCCIFLLQDLSMCSKAFFYLTLMSWDVHSMSVTPKQPKTSDFLSLLSKYPPLLSVISSKSMSCCSSSLRSDMWLIASHKNLQLNKITGQPKWSLYTLIRALLSHCEIGLDVALTITSSTHKNAPHTLLNESHALTCGIVLEGGLFTENRLQFHGFLEIISVTFIQAL